MRRLFPSLHGYRREWLRGDVVAAGGIVKVVFDVGDDVYVDVERHLAAAITRD